MSSQLSYQTTTTITTNSTFHVARSLHSPFYATFSWKGISLNHNLPDCVCVVMVVVVQQLSCELMDHRPPGFFVHGVLQARILEWVAISFSRVLFLFQVEPGPAHTRPAPAELTPPLTGTIVSFSFLRGSNRCSKVRSPGQGQVRWSWALNSGCQILRPFSVRAKHHKTAENSLAASLLDNILCLHP